MIDIFPAKKIDTIQNYLQDILYNNKIREEEKCTQTHDTLHTFCLQCNLFIMHLKQARIRPFNNNNKNELNTRKQGQKLSSDNKFFYVFFLVWLFSSFFSFSFLSNLHIFSMPIGVFTALFIII